MKTEGLHCHYKDPSFDTLLQSSSHPNNTISQMTLSKINLPYSYRFLQGHMTKILHDILYASSVSLHAICLIDAIIIIMSKEEYTPQSYLLYHSLSSVLTAVICITLLLKAPCLRVSCQIS